MVAIDSESDSLHHFPEKVCLIQVGTAEGEVFLVDPLVLRDLAPLAPMLADPAVVKVLHGAAYDLASMKRDFAFEIRRALRYHGGRPVPRPARGRTGGAAHAGSWGSSRASRGRKTTGRSDP